jgi:hypothetical protein
MYFWFVPLKCQGGGQGSCGMCPDGKYSSASGSISCIGPIFEFKAPYQLSQITDLIQKKMALAIVKMLGVNEDSVILSFTSSILRRRVLLQRIGVLVSVGLTNFQTSTSIFASRITSENLNAAMAAEGLEAVLLITTFSTGNDRSDEMSLFLPSRA